MSRHTATHPRARFVRVRRARLIGDWCIECHRHIDQHALVRIDGEWQSHCDHCNCDACPEEGS